jgi:hypothetical protein
MIEHGWYPQDAPGPLAAPKNHQDASPIPDQVEIAPGSRSPASVGSGPRSFASSDKEIIYLLRSIRGMLIFFTILAVVGLIGGIISVVQLVHAASTSTNGF